MRLSQLRRVRIGLTAPAAVIDAVLAAELGAERRVA